MDIQTFFTQSEGRWFSQRTRYQITNPEADNSKSDITVELLPPNHERVTQLCKQYRVDPAQVWQGVKISWDTSADWSKPKQVGSTVLVVLPEGDHTGKLLRDGAGKGFYQISDDESVTLVVDAEGMYSEERLWFASENLRLRTTLVKNSQGVVQTGFYSEIRRLPPKED
ncbi:phycobiliprotein lyase [Spirulina sp. CS-785/01]|uniref:phycobiliprotein lyase n=1 Tax=Spirulina sp. CS-785/01 TaxID=3021716 RepID=UPI00232F9025|nr:phycobiliprotein lyase [Spirulina sp. CS-785/01]MDB9314721.1 phycobiliprotein lyase [Spirulina sp. CS-785/01]